MSDGWHNIEKQVDSNGNPTAVAKAIQAIIDSGCECEEEDRDGECTGGCFPGLAEAAIHEQFDEIARLKADLDLYKTTAAIRGDLLSKIAKALIEVAPELEHTGENYPDLACKTLRKFKAELDAAKAQHPDVAAIQAEARRETLKEALTTFDDIPNVGHDTAREWFVEQLAATQPTPSKQEAPAADVDGLAKMLAAKFGWPLDHADNVASEAMHYIMHGSP